MKNGCIDELFSIYSLVQNMLLCGKYDEFFLKQLLIFQ